MTTLTDQQMERYTKLLGRVLFPDEWSFSKVLWRMSRGSRSAGIKIARNFLKHYDFPSEMTTEEFEEMFDQACADVNDGIEVEWLEE
ncbi:MAG: hypothetical protein CTY12_00800 [Methylotenera sp.]|nr:MAG: hypothetical protein CTY12_00800 [Methylotenera sp.]